MPDVPLIAAIVFLQSWISGCTGKEVLSLYLGLKNFLLYSSLGSFICCCASFCMSRVPCICSCRNFFTALAPGYFFHGSLFNPPLTLDSACTSGTLPGIL